MDILFAVFLVVWGYCFWNILNQPITPPKKKSRWYDDVHTMD